MSEVCLERLHEVLQRHYGRSPDVVQESLLRVIQKLHDGVPLEGSLEGYVLVVAKHVSREFERKGRLLERPVPAMVSCVPDPEPVSMDRLTRVMRETLPTSDRELFRNYFFPGVKDLAGHRLRLAKRLGVAPNSLCQRANRIRQKLERAIAKHQKGSVG